MSGQAPRVEVAGAVPSEQAARLLQAVEEVDRRYNYYGGAGLATRHQVGMVGPHQTVALAIPGRAGRCHRIAFASEIPGISVSLQHLAFRQGPVIGSTGALGQYRQICPTSSVVYRLEVTTNAPAPIAFAVHQTEFAR